MMKIKSILLTINVLILTIFISSCNNTSKNSTNNESGVVEKDSVLAKKLQADDYGMKQYVMVFLKSGPNRSQSDDEAKAIQRAHLDNIKRLAEKGVLVMAGPFLDNGELRGIYIFNVESIEAARELTETDPAVKSGRLIMELHPWYGSAAIQELPEIHQRIAMKDI
ncbi:YciI family protein [Saccharicrinis sp. FJH62]|uniref:YciI family protein n=1 Tax=Saccharicrinis sp. FJH62 TaxID=3344657 RepID=UPI0035D48240